MLPLYFNLVKDLSGVVIKGSLVTFDTCLVPTSKFLFYNLLTLVDLMLFLYPIMNH